MEESPDEKEPSTVLTPDANNATYFDPNDASGSNSTNYQRLRLLNRGTWENRWEENKEVTHRRDNLAILDSIAGQLDMNSYQKKESRRIFDDLNLGTIGKPVDLVAFGVCCVVANRDVPNGSRFYPEMDNPDRQFVKIADRLDFTTKQLYSVIGTVIHRTVQ